MQLLRERLTLALVGLLPLHALLVTFGTKLIKGPGQAPWAALAIWKEVLLGVILLIAIWELFHKKWRMEDEHMHVRFSDFDVIDWLIVGLVIISIPVSALTHGDAKLYLLGFKYDFIPLVAFMILRRVNWNQDFLKECLAVLSWVGLLVAGYGVLSLALPQSFFVWLGYSDLHSLYLPDGPIAAYQQIGEIGLRRIQSTLSGPNQLGLWLLIPWSIGLSAIIHTCHEQPVLKAITQSFVRCKPTIWAILYTVLIGSAIFLTFARAAWLAAAAIFFIILWEHASRKKATQWSIRLFGLGVMIIALVLTLEPQAIIKRSSSIDHVRLPAQAFASMLEQPLGQGLGVVGPASNRVSDACVLLEPGADTTWAADRPDLCVFAGDTQVQPAGRTCNCPKMTENWFLQIGVELGLLGFALFIALVFWVMAALKKHDDLRLMFIGVCLAGLFLHSFEAAAVAYSLWVLMAVGVTREN